MTRPKPAPDAPFEIVRTLLSDVSQRTQGDHRFGGDLLRTTVQRMSIDIQNHLQGDPSDRLSGLGAPPTIVQEWDRLVREVVEQYSAERRMIEYGLELREFRPRTAFALLPE